MPGANSGSPLNSPKLYRAEAVEAATSRYGAPVKPIGLAGWALTSFLVSICLCVSIFLVLGRYTRKETVTGVLQPASGAARVTALDAGVVSLVHVIEGQTVEAGDPIVTITSDPSVSTDGGSATGLSDLIRKGAVQEAVAIANQARAQLDVSAGALNDLYARRAGLEEDQIELTQSISLQQERVRLAQETLSAGRSLHERQLFSTLQLRQREEAAIVAQQGVDAIQREIRRNRALLDQMRAEESRLRAQLDQSNSQVAQIQAQFDQRQAIQLAERATILVARKAGRVVALQARSGAPVQPGRALAIILPAGSRLQAELWVPSRAAGFIAVGDRVRLMYDAFPYQKFGVGRGTVVIVAGAPTDPSDLTTPIDTTEALYRVVVDVDEGGIEGYGRQLQLTPGMRLAADLILDDRSLWEWLFDPVIAARERSGT